MSSISLEGKGIGESREVLTTSACPSFDLEQVKEERDMKNRKLYGNVENENEITSRRTADNSILDECSGADIEIEGTSVALEQSCFVKADEDSVIDSDMIAVPMEGVKFKFSESSLPSKDANIKLESNIRETTEIANDVKDNEKEKVLPLACTEYYNKKGMPIKKEFHQGKTMYETAKRDKPISDFGVDFVPFEIESNDSNIKSTTHNPLIKGYNDDEIPEHNSATEKKYIESYFSQTNQNLNNKTILGPLFLLEQANYHSYYNHEEEDNKRALPSLVVSTEKLKKQQQQQENVPSGIHQNNRFVRKFRSHLNNRMNTFKATFSFKNLNYKNNRVNQFFRDQQRNLHDKFSKAAFNGSVEKTQRGAETSSIPVNSVKGEEEGTNISSKYYRRRFDPFHIEQLSEDIDCRPSRSTVITAYSLLFGGIGIFICAIIFSILGYDGIVPLVILGVLVIIPGCYASIQVYGNAHGWKGYDEISFIMEDVF